MQPLGKDRRHALLRALVAAEKDIVGIAEEHKVSLEQLAEWSAGEDVQRQLASLCSVADAQAQFQLSRFRLHVAQGLLADALQKEGNDTHRKARLEAMKLEVWQPFAAVAPAPTEPSTDAADGAAALRALLAGQPGGGERDAEHD